MTYKEHLRSFAGKTGQLVYEGGRCEITFYADRADHTAEVMGGDACDITGPLGQSVFCETDPGLKSIGESGNCRIIEVHEDFVLIECDNRGGSKDIKAVPFDSLIITVMEKGIT